MAWIIEFYKTSSGESPVQKFIDQLELKTQTKVADALAILNEVGPFLKPPYMKKLAPNLYELRIKSTVAVRIFYSPRTRRYYLLHAFVKKSTKTPLKELKIAIDRMKTLI